MSAPKGMPPHLHTKWCSVVRRRYSTIREYAEAWIQLVHYIDGDGRAIGFDYERIRSAVLRKFPKVTCNGPHKGRKTKMPYKELGEFACELNRQGIRLPFRPRRKAKKG
jgi:hypothetical protein